MSEKTKYPPDLLLCGDEALNYLKIPDDMTVVDMLRESFKEYSDIPAFLYHAKSLVVTVSRQKFMERVDTYAKALDALGVKENECVPIYSPSIPEMIYIVMALIQLGAWGNALKLDMTAADMDFQTSESKIAVVFDGMYDKVKQVFEQERFEKVIVISALDSLALPFRIIGGGSARKEAEKTGASLPPYTAKYIRRKDIYRLAKKYTAAPKAKSVSEREAMGTYSSASGGRAKCAVASNKSIIANVKQARIVNPSYEPGTYFLDHFPLVSTAACLLLLTPLDSGMTVIIDPLAVYSENYYESIFKFKAGFTLTTGPEIRKFFKTLTERKESRSLEFLQSLVVGAEGITKEDYLEYLDILASHGVKNPRSVLTQGYGLSECFSVVSSEVPHIQLPGDGMLRLINSVGMVYPGSKAEIYSRDGKPLGSNKAGEIWIDRENTLSLMSRYYLNPELQEKNMPKGGKYLYTGDIGELGADGQLYVYGRASEYLGTSNGMDIYANTIANYIINAESTIDLSGKPEPNTKPEFDPDVRYCFINRIPLEANKSVTVAHIVLRKQSVGNAAMHDIIVRLSQKLQKYFPQELIPVGYRVYDGFLPTSPTTLKTDRITLESYRDGFLCGFNGKLTNVSFVQGENGLQLKI